VDWYALELLEVLARNEFSFLAKRLEVDTEQELSVLISESSVKEGNISSCVAERFVKKKKYHTGSTSYEDAQPGAGFSGYADMYEGGSYLGPLSIKDSIRR
jgi:hypothetical protein